MVYSKAMPDIESLMQVWDPQFEEMLATTQLPSPMLDLNLEEYTRIVCSLFDIPVHQNSVESLHVLFTLFSEFKNNQHFQQDRQAAGGDGMGAGGDMGAGEEMNFGGAGFHSDEAAMDLAMGGMGGGDMGGDPEVMSF